MPKLIYTPKALDDLQGIKAYVARQLELFPGEGPRLEKLIEYPTDYQYLVVKPNYVFYRVEGDAVRIIRILNEKQDFLLSVLSYLTPPTRNCQRINGAAKEPQES